jgi:glycosyltransferase involved in cell wall biosynthesis
MSLAEISAGGMDEVGAEGEDEVLEGLRREADREQRMDGGDDAAQPALRGMEIPVVPPIVDEVFTVNAGKLRAGLTTTGKAGALEEDQPKVGPKGEGAGATESKDTKGKAGLRPVSRAGASESDSLASELADSPVSESLNRSASIPSSSLDTSHSLPFIAPGVPKARRFVVGMAARSLTDRGKGIQEFFARLPVDRAFAKETTFVLIGDGKIRVPAGLDCRFSGHIDSPERLAEMYRSLDVFVSPSAMETFGMAILEAQACGTPVVAFETGGTPEAVCPVASKLARNGDWAGLFREVEAMFDSAVKDRGKNRELSEWVAQNYSWQAIAEKQKKIYTESCGECN